MDSGSETRRSRIWTLEENRVFESTLTDMKSNMDGFFEIVQVRVPSKTIAQIVKHYENLESDINDIEDGSIEVPDYEAFKMLKQLELRAKHAHTEAPTKDLFTQSQQSRDLLLLQPHAPVHPHTIQPHNSIDMQTHAPFALPGLHLGQPYTQLNQDQAHNQVNSLPQFQADTLAPALKHVVMHPEFQFVEIGQSSTFQLAQSHTEVQPQSWTWRRWVRRGVPWTDDEHMKFLEGLGKYGKGNWKIISELCVKTKTQSQVASHAQKFFLRMYRTHHMKRTLSNTSYNYNQSFMRVNQVDTNVLQDSSSTQKDKEVPSFNRKTTLFMQGNDSNLNMHDPSIMQVTDEETPNQLLENFETFQETGFMGTLDQETSEFTLEDFNCNLDDFDFIDLDESYHMLVNQESSSSSNMQKIN